MVLMSDEWCNEAAAPAPLLCSYCINPLTDHADWCVFGDAAWAGPSDSHPDADDPEQVAEWL